MTVAEFLDPQLIVAAADLRRALDRFDRIDERDSMSPSVDFVITPCRAQLLRMLLNHAADILKAPDDVS
jgi:hypothetical protein